MSGKCFFHFRHTDGFHNLTGFLGEDLNGLLNFRFRMFGLVKDHIIRILMGPDEQARAIGFNGVTFFPGLVGMTGRIVTPDSDFTFTQMGGARNRATFRIYPVCTGTRMRFFPGSREPTDLRVSVSTNSIRLEALAAIWK